MLAPITSPMPLRGYFRASAMPSSTKQKEASGIANFFWYSTRYRITFCW